MKSRAPIDKARRIAAQRSDLQWTLENPAELVGILAAEAGCLAQQLRHLLDNGVDTREKLTALLQQYLKDKAAYETLSEQIRKGEAHW